MPDANAGTADTTVATVSAHTKPLDAPVPDWYPWLNGSRTTTIGTATSATAYTNDRVATSAPPGGTGPPPTAPAARACRRAPPGRHTSGVGTPGGPPPPPRTSLQSAPASSTSALTNAAGGRFGHFLLYVAPFRACEP